MSIGPSIAKALAALQAELPTVAKSKRANVGQYGYTYADLSDVSEAVMPLLSKHGLAFTAPPRRTEHGYFLVGILMHESGEFIEGDYPLTGNQPQQIGSAITYGRRYLLGCMTGVVTDDDDDGHLAQEAATKKRAKAETSEPRTQTMSRPKPAEKTPGGASPAQVRMIGALMSQLGLTDRNDALRYVADVIGREVGSRNDLSGQEASQVIDALQKEGTDGIPA